MIEITSTLQIEEREVQLEFVRASGPGGQKVNKVCSAVQLRFDVCHSPSLPEDVKTRLARLAGGRMSDAGVLVIDARRHRTQELNRVDAVERLISLLRQAAQPRRARKPTLPSAAARAARLEHKRRRALLKRRRQMRDVLGPLQ